MNEKLEEIKSRKFGVENEFEEISRQRMADAIQSVIGGRQVRSGYAHNAIAVVAPDGREWKAMSDGSLRNGAEFVTPILGWDDLPTYQECIRAIRRAGAKTPSTTSQHVHVGAADLTPQQVANLVRSFYKQEVLIHKAFGTLESRLQRYTQPCDRAFVDRIIARKPRTMRELNEAWFGEYRPTFAHYDSHRYHSLNISPLFEEKRTVEFRFGNGTTHAGEARSMAIFCLAMVAKAKLARAASGRNPREYNETTARFDFRVALLHLGLIGDEFKTVRHHLLKRLPGSAAWRNGRPENN